MEDLHTQMMHCALQQAKNAAVAGEVPVGAVVYTADGKVLAKNHNRVEELGDATAHAEFLACRQAVNAREEMYLDDCYVAVTLEPCAMCAQALSWWRVKEIRFGAYDVKSGGTVNGPQVLKYAHWKPEVYGGILEQESFALLQKFFKDRR